MYRHALCSRRVLGAAVLCCLAALTPLAALAISISPAASASPGTTSKPACATSGLVIWLNTQGSGTAGALYYSLELTNLSGRSCALAGFPGVSAVSLSGKQLGSAASRDPGKKASVITLANGSTATALLRITEAGNYTPSACVQVTAAGLRVYPPNQTTSKVVSFPYAACSRTGPVYLGVEALQKGLPPE